MRKRVLYISHDGSASGGAALALLDFFNDMKNKNLDIEPIVLIPAYNGLEKELQKINVKYLKLYYSPWAFEKSSYFFCNLKRLIIVLLRQMFSYINLIRNIKKIRMLNVDIIHTNSSIIGIGCYINSILNIKHVIHVREFGEEHHNLRFLLGRNLTRKYMDIKSDKIILISNALKDKYIEYINSEKLEVIYDGVSNKYENIRLNKKRKVFNILISGTIQRGKGQLDVVKAIGLTHLDNIKLYIAGQVGDLKYFQLINSYIRDNELSSKIEIIGNIKDMNKLRKNIDVEIVNSYMEGFGRVTIEAMLSEIPIIASKSGANEELIKDKVNGLLYEYGNINELVRCIKEIYLNDEEKNIFMGKRGFDIAKKNFLQCYNTEKVINLYDKLMEED